MKSYDAAYFVGDSYVYGVDQLDDINKDVTIDNRFSALVSNHIGAKEINAGIPGACNFLILQRLYADLPSILAQYKNIIVFCFFSDYSRDCVEIKDDNYYVKNKQHDSHFIQNYFTEGFYVQRTNTCVHAAQTLLLSNSIDFVDGYSMGKAVDDEYDHTTTEFRLRNSIANLCSPDLFYIGTELSGCEPTGHLTVAGNKKFSDILVTRLSELYR